MRYTPRRNVRLAGLLLLHAAIPKVAPAQEIKAPNCVAADTIFGPLTSRQAKIKTIGAYGTVHDSTSVYAGTGRNPDVTAIATVPGHTPTLRRPPAKLRISVPYYLTERKDAAEISMYAQIDDSARVSLGPPIILAWAAGSPRPSDFGIRNMSIGIEINADFFLRIAQARKLVISWFGSNTKASDDELAAINVLYRTLLCVAVPPPRP